MLRRIVTFCKIGCTMYHAVLGSGHLEKDRVSAISFLIGTDRKRSFPITDLMLEKELGLILQETQFISLMRKSNELIEGETQSV